MFTFSLIFVYFSEIRFKLIKFLQHKHYKTQKKESDQIHVFERPSQSPNLKSAWDVRSD